VGFAALGVALSTGLAMGDHSEPGGSR
jgi:hypothetical protein